VLGAAVEEARVQGVVRDAETGKPIPGAIISVVGADVPPVATDAREGLFLTHGLPAGTVRLEVRKDGYREEIHEVTARNGQTGRVELALQREVRKGRLAVTVRSEGRPLEAEVVVTGTESSQKALASQAGTLEFPVGTYTVAVRAEGFLAQARRVKLAEGEPLPVSFTLVPAPRRPLVVLRADRLETAEQVGFAPERSALSPNDRALVAHLVDALVRHDIQRLRVEGHADSQESRGRAEALSRARAQSVASLLVEAGIDPARIEVVGHGDARPVAPNLTPRGRELNRRVEFTALER
jgi:OmpA-OmpF porin, OOP family